MDARVTAPDTGRIHTAEGLQALPVGTEVWVESGKKYRVDLWSSYFPFVPEDGRVLVGHGGMDGVDAFIGLHGWASLTPVEAPAPSRAERIASRAAELSASLLPPGHTAEDAFGALDEAAKLVAELEETVADLRREMPR